MKFRNITLSVLLLAFLMYGCGNNLFSSLADDNSDEACMYKTSLDLDKGDYDAVLSSGCLDSLQKGAAYLGKSGFDVIDVINSLSEAQDDTMDDLNIYLKSLVSTVTEASLNNLEASADAYDEVADTADSYEDAQFYKAIVKSLRSLSLLKLVTDIDGNGLFSGCDINNNNVPDDVDAAACSLLIAVTDTPCSSSVVSSQPVLIPDLSLQGKSGLYRGVPIIMQGTATAECPAEYRQLHYLAGGSTYGAATITSEICQEMSPDSNRTWPCPVETGGDVLDLVGAFDEAITDSIDALENAFNADNDIFDSILEIKTEACGLDATCSSDEIAEYLNDITVNGG